MARVVHEFRFSEAFARRQTHGVVASLTCLVLIAVPSAILIERVSGQTLRTADAVRWVVLLGLGCAGAVMALLRQLVLWRMTRLHVGDEGLALKSGKDRDVVRWDEVTRATLCRRPDGGPALLRLRLTRRGGLDLYGFRDMPGLAGLVRAKLPANAERRQRTWVLDWHGPARGVLAGACWAPFVGLYLGFRPLPPPPAIIAAAYALAAVATVAAAANGLLPPAPRVRRWRSPAVATAAVVVVLVGIAAVAAGVGLALMR
jgi:hypothetical protein